MTGRLGYGFLLVPCLLSACLAPDASPEVAGETWEYILHGSVIENVTHSHGETRKALGPLFTPARVHVEFVPGPDDERSAAVVREHIVWANGSRESFDRPLAPPAPTQEPFAAGALWAIPEDIGVGDAWTWGLAFYGPDIASIEEQARPWLPAVVRSTATRLEDPRGSGGGQLLRIDSSLHRVDLDERVQELEGRMKEMFPDRSDEVSINMSYEGEMVAWAEPALGRTVEVQLTERAVVYWCLPDDCVLIEKQKSLTLTGTGEDLEGE